MAQSAAPPIDITPATAAALPVRVVLPWAAFFGILMLVLLYFVGSEPSLSALGETSRFVGLA
jgi:hypothetical protein